MDKAFWAWFYIAHRWLRKLLLSEHMPSYRLKGQRHYLFLYGGLIQTCDSNGTPLILRCIDSWWYILGFIYICSQHTYIWQIEVESNHHNLKRNVAFDGVFAILWMKTSQCNLKNALNYTYKNYRILSLYWFAY